MSRSSINRRRWRVLAAAPALAMVAAGVATSGVGGAAQASARPVADASALQTSFFREQGYLKGTRDGGDPSYQRPLRLDPEAPRW